MTDIHITEGPERGLFTDKEMRRRWTWLMAAVTSAMSNPRSETLRWARVEFGSSSRRGLNCILDLQKDSVAAEDLLAAIAELADHGLITERVDSTGECVGLLLGLNPKLSREDHIAVARLQLNALAETAGP